MKFKEKITWDELTSQMKVMLFKPAYIFSSIAGSMFYCIQEDIDITKPMKLAIARRGDDTMFLLNAEHPVDNWGFVSEPFGNKATITVPFEEYHALKRNRDMLECLENNGVDNWVGYGDSCSDHRENYPEE